ncbi:MAG: SDR family oxidoreductase [Myxococcota bacterium]
MDLGLEGRRVLVTGASSGIGRAVALAFADEGASVVAHAHRAHASLAQWCGPRAIPTVAGDLADPGDAERVIDAAAAAVGRLDAAVAVAGWWPPDDLPLDRTPVDVLRRAVDDNLWTALWTARAFLRHLRSVGPAPGGASLVFVGSTAGAFGEADHAGYAAAKSALHGLAASLKNEIVAIDPAGRVNGVRPGWTATPTVAERLDPAVVARVTRTMALRRIADPSDVASAVVFASSPVAARHLTGEWWTVAGGMEGRILHD